MQNQQKGRKISIANGMTFEKSWGSLEQQKKNLKKQTKWL